MHSSHAANQRANISLIDRRFRRPRRVPYLAIGFRNSPTVLRGQDVFDSVDTESHINEGVEKLFSSPHCALNQNETQVS